MFFIESYKGYKVYQTRDKKTFKAVCVDGTELIGKTISQVRKNINFLINTKKSNKRRTR